MIKYTFREDEILTIKNAKKANPQVIGEALTKLADEAKGHLTPAAVVKAAQSRTSPLHPFFEWDDEKAAEAYRADQARSLIRSIHVEPIDSEASITRAFLSINDKGGTSYRPIGDILQSADLQSKVLAAAERDLLAFEARYRSLSEICDLVRAARRRVASQRTNLESRAVA